MKGRFDYVAFDDLATEAQMAGKSICQALETCLEMLGPGRAQSLALTKLEECYMWMGKAIRDDLVRRQNEKKE